MSRIIDGKAISAAVKARIQSEVSALTARGISVGLAVIIVGENPASKIYVANKKKACEALGIVSEEYALSESTTEQELLELINTLNNKKSINGILCQLPLPQIAILPQRPDVGIKHTITSLFPRPLAVSGQAENVVGADVIVLAEFHKIGNGRRVVARLIAGDLYLMIADGRRQLPLTLIVVDADVDHALNHVISPLFC